MREQRVIAANRTHGILSCVSQNVASRPGKVTLTFCPIWDPLRTLTYWSKSSKGHQVNQGGDKHDIWGESKSSGPLILEKRCHQSQGPAAAQVEPGSVQAHSCWRTGSLFCRRPSRGRVEPASTARPGEVPCPAGNAIPTAAQMLSAFLATRVPSRLSSSYSFLMIQQWPLLEKGALVMRCDCSCGFTS